MRVRVLLLARALIVLARRALASADPNGIHLPGWTCPDCETFNGEAKERMESCRRCDGPRP